MPTPRPRSSKRRSATLPDRGFLMHLTHYDPRWCRAKDREEPFDPKLGNEIIDTMAEAGLNLLIVDCADAVRYASHPELRRPYTRPMSVLRKLADRARRRGLEVVPKLNFSQSGLNRHNHWFRPHHMLFDQDEYWRRAFLLIDELIGTARPERFFHIGMDEDHWRSHRQYVAAIKTLRKGLRQRGLRTVMWNDSAIRYPSGEAHREKALVAEKAVPRNIVQLYWNYRRLNVADLRRIRDSGFELWGAPGRDPKNVSAMRRGLLRWGGKGIVLTRWFPCTQANRDELLAHVARLGPLCGEA